MPRPLANKRLRYISLAAILCIAYAVNLWLVSLDNRPPVWDYAGYFSQSLSFYDAIRRGSWSAFSQVFLWDLYRPPVVPLTALPFYMLLGTGYKVALLVNLVFLTVLVLSIYKIGSRLKSQALGLVAAGIVVTLPGIIDYNRVFGLDFALTAMSAATFCLGIESEGLSKRRESIALGIVAGLSFLVKWSYIVIGLPLVVAELAQHREEVRLSNVAIAVAVASVIALPWYGPSLTAGLTTRLTREAAPEPINATSSLEMFGVYPRELYLHLVGPMYSTLLLGFAVLSIAVLVVLRKRDWVKSGLDSSAAKSLAFTFFVALFCFTLFANKSPRFVLPVVPIVVLVMVRVGWDLHPRWAPLLMLGIVLCGSAVSVVGVVHPTMGSQLGIFEPGSLPDAQPLLTYNDPAISWPLPYNWKLDEVVSYIGIRNSSAKVGILANHWYVNQDTLRSYALLLGYDNLSFTDFRDEGHIRGDPYALLSDFDFVLLKTGVIGRPFDTQDARQLIQILQNPHDPFYSKFDNLTSFNLPDASELFIFAKHNPLSGPTSHSSTASIDTLHHLGANSVHREVAKLLYCPLNRFSCAKSSIPRDKCVSLHFL